MFVDLSGSTQIASNLEPEEYGEILEEFRTSLQSTTERYGGEIIRIDGDGALCLFGYPVCYEDSGRRAVETALEVHGTIQASGVIRRLTGRKLELHTGIHAGAVLLRLGDIVRGRYEVLGDATNVAARICDAAKSGEILVTLETLGRDRQRFEAGAVRSIEAGGHEQGFDVLPIKAVRSVEGEPASPRRGASSAFIGRVNERRAIQAWLEKSDCAPLLVLHGQAGIGKSRLLAQVTLEAADAGWLTVRGSSDPYLGARALQPFAEITKSLEVLSDQNLHSDERRIRETIEQLGDERPALVILDDWQWADEKSRQLLSSVVEKLEHGGARRALKFLVSSRKPWSAEEAVQPWQSLLLSPFIGDDLETAIQTLLPACDTLTAGSIKEASGGTPLLLEEVCHAVSAGRVLDTSSVPNTWYDLAVQARVQALSKQDVQFLQLCAVTGNKGPLWLLAAVQGSALDRAQLSRLEAADLLQTSAVDDFVYFKHGMTRDAVYSGIGLNHRREMHRQIAEILKSAASHDVGGREEALSRHLFASEQIEQALPFSISAADRALSAGALDRAQFHYRAAFSGIERLEHSADHVKSLRHIIKSFGRATVVDPMRHHVEFLERLLKFANLVGDAHSIALATYWIGSHYYGLGEPRKSLAVLGHAHGLAVVLGANTFAVQIKANLGQTNAVAGRYKDALRFMDTAVESKMTNGDRSEPSTSLAYCLSSRGLVKADMGDFDGAYRDFDASIEALVDMQHPILPSLETQRCLALIYHGRFEEASERAEFSERASEHSHARFLVFSARALGNFAHYARIGQGVYFDRFVEATLRLFSSGRLQRISYKFAWICEVMVERGEFDQARLFASLAFKRALKGDRLGEASAARALAQLSARSQNRSSMLRYLAMADKAGKTRISRRELALNQLCAGRCFFALGDAQKAKRHFDSAAGSFKQLGMRQFDSELAHASFKLSER